MMNLDDYLKRKLRDEFLSARRFAHEIGLNAQYVSQIRRGDRKASMEVIKKIEKYTGWEVNRYGLRPDLFPSPEEDYKYLKILISNVA